MNAKCPGNSHSFIFSLFFFSNNEGRAWDGEAFKLLKYVKKGKWKSIQFNKENFLLLCHLHTHNTAKKVNPVKFDKREKEKKEFSVVHAAKERGAGVEDVEVKEIKSFLFFYCRIFMLQMDISSFSAVYHFFLFFSLFFLSLPFPLSPSIASQRQSKWGRGKKVGEKRLHIIYVRLSRLSKCGDEGNNKVKL